MSHRAFAVFAIVVFGGCRRGGHVEHLEVEARATPPSEADAGPPAPAKRSGLCHGAWCFEDPLPTGEELVDVVTGARGDAIVATAGAGTLGSSLLRWDGKQFSAIDVAEHVTSLYRASASEVWATTREGAVLRGDGHKWTAIATGVTTPLLAVWGSASDAIWAVGDDGVILFFDGATWTRRAAPVKARLHAVRGRARDDVWAAGEGVILHFDGSAWRVAERVVPGPRARKVVAGGFCGTGAASAMHHNQALTSVRALAVLGPDNVIAAAGSGRVLHFDGKSWREEDLTAKGLRTIDALWAASSKSVFAVGDHAIAHFDGATWTAESRDPSEQFHAVAGSDENNMWVVGALGTVLRGSPAKLERVSGFGARANVSAAFVGAREAFAVGGDLILRRKPSGEWFRAAQTTTEKSLSSIGGSADNDVWTFEFDGPPLRWNGSAWTEEARATSTPRSVRAAAPDDIWANGGGELLHFNGKAWERVDAKFELFDIWAPSRGVAYATGRQRDESGKELYAKDGVLVRWDGTAWSKVIDVPINAWGIGGSGDKVWIADDHDVYLYDGKSLALAYKDPARDGYGGQRSVIVRASNDVLVAGHGRAVTFDGVGWKRDDPPLANATFAGGAAGMFGFGASGGIVRRR